MEKTLILILKKDKTCVHSIRYAGTLPENPAIKMQVYIPTEAGVPSNVPEVKTQFTWSE